MSDQVNPLLEFAKRLFKDLVWNAAVDLALAALFLEAPYLAWPPLKQMISGVVRLGTDKIFGIMSMTIDLGAVVLINAEHRRQYDRAYAELYIVARDSGENSEAFRKARDNAKQHLAQFVHFNG
jgi:hypothetical protein